MVRRVLGEWTDPERVAEYLSREIPHRGIAEELLLEALPHPSCAPRYALSRSLRGSRRRTR